MKKIFYSLGAALTIATPIITVVSCGKQEKTTKSHSLSSKNDNSLSEGLEINDDKITIDFALANFDSSKFAQDVLNFFNSHRGRKVGIDFKNSPNQKLNDHEIEMRVSINGYSDFETLLGDIISKIDTSLIDIDFEKLMAYQAFSGESIYKNVPLEQIKADYEKYKVQISQIEINLSRYKTIYDQTQAALRTAEANFNSAKQAYNQAATELNALLPSDQQVQLAHSFGVRNFFPPSHPSTVSSSGIDAAIKAAQEAAQRAAAEAARVAQEAAQRAAAEAARVAKIPGAQAKLSGVKASFDQAQAALIAAQTSFNGAKSNYEEAQKLFAEAQLKIHAAEEELKKFN